MWRRISPGALATALSFLDFSSRLAATVACREFRCAARSQASMPTAVVVRAPRVNAVRAQPPPSLWLLTRLHTLRIAKLVCLSKRSIGSLGGLARLRHLAATVDVRATWRFPTTLETLELTCGERDSTARVRPHSARLHVRTFASLATLRRLTIDASLSERPGRVTALPPGLVELDYAGPLSRSVRHPGLVVTSIARCVALASVHITEYLSGGACSVLGALPHLERASLRCFDVERSATADIADRRLFAPLRELAFSCQYGSTLQMIGAAARMPTLETLRVDDYPYESLRPLSCAGGFCALVSLAVTDTWLLVSLDGVEYFASTLRALDLSRTRVRETRALEHLTGLERLFLDDVSPTSGERTTFSLPLPSVRHLSLRGCAHWHPIARKTFPNAEIMPAESFSAAESLAPSAVC